jgi:zinc resistance-associated protein
MGELNMNRLVAISSTALVILGFGSAMGQNRFDGQGSMRPRLSAEDLSAFTDARAAALKAGLELTPDQAKNWPAFEQAYRNIAQLRRNRLMMRRGQTSPTMDQSFADRLQRRADAVTQYGAALEELAKATKPLYQSLDDAQKRRFMMLAHLAGHHHRHLARSRRSDRMLGFNTHPERNFGEQQH